MDEALLTKALDHLNGALMDPLKTTVVQNSAMHDDMGGAEERMTSRGFQRTKLLYPFGRKGQNSHWKLNCTCRALAVSIISAVGVQTVIRADENRIGVVGEVVNAKAKQGDPVVLPPFETFRDPNIDVE